MGPTSVADAKLLSTHSTSPDLLPDSRAQVTAVVTGSIVRNATGPGCPGVPESIESFSGTMSLDVDADLEPTDNPLPDYVWDNVEFFTQFPDGTLVDGVVDGRLSWY